MWSMVGNGTYYPGESLADRLDRLPGQALAESEALGIFEQLLAGVRAAHESTPTVIHRDIKPDNVYLADVRGERRALLMDFGIAKVLQEGRLRTQTGARMGTVAYMAPEQIQASKSVGPGADVFSLGVLLYEMLCGQRPFVSDSDLMLPGVVVAAQVPEGPLRGVAPALRAVIRRCLQKEAGARYASVAQLQRATFQGGQRRPVPPPPPAPPRHDSRTMLLAALAVLLALGAVGSWLALGPEGRAKLEDAPASAPEKRHPAIEAPPAAAWNSEEFQARLAQLEAGVRATEAEAKAAQARAARAKAAREPNAGPWGTKWVSLPGGSFQMGSTSGDSDGQPVHQVRVGAFAVMKSEVTVGMYRACVGAGRCEEPKSGGFCNWGGVKRREGVLTWRPRDGGLGLADLPPGGSCHSPHGTLPQISTSEMHRSSHLVPG